MMAAMAVLKRLAATHAVAHLWRWFRQFTAYGFLLAGEGRHIQRPATAPAETLEGGAPQAAAGSAGAPSTPESDHSRAASAGEANIMNRRTVSAP